VIFVTFLSRCFSKKLDRPLWIASGILNMINFINRVVLMALLWPTVQLAMFTVTGFVILATSLLGIYES
jgi:hypothetical protein